MDINNFQSGYIPSKLDPRNYGISRIVAPVNVFPDEFELDISKIAIENQNVSCCVMEFMCYHLAYVYKDLFSVGFGYGNRDDNDLQTPGMEPLQMLKHMKNEGNVLRKDFPLIEEMPDIRNEVLKVKPQLLPKANQYRIASYAQLNGIDDIKNALMQLKTPVLMGIEVYLTFAIPDPTGFCPAPIPAIMDKTYGGHAITIYGWDKRGFKALNSWGTEWTKTGTCVLDYDYPILEAWAITDKVAQPPQPTPVNKWYRVQCGSFKIFDKANKMAQEIISLGYKGYLAYIDGCYKVQVDAFPTKAEAEKLEAELKAKRYDCFIVYY